ncbi:MAG: sensor histidine kinase, partial [Actinophytocola sp.]|uniref:sensor histidine kinase n=1 Tax=Actinophytocola sp. TaxID=1872138 RepID=UPI003D6AB333
MLAIVLIPSAALLVIGVGASGYLVYQGYNAQEWATTMQATVAPGTQLASLVEEERRLSLLHMGGDKKAAAELAKQRTELDTLLGGLQTLNEDLIKLNPDAIGETIAASQQVFGQLPQIRQGVDSGQASSRDVYDFYNQAVDIVKQGLQGIAKTAPDSVTAVEESTATTLYDVADAMSRGHALAAGGVTNGGLTVEEFEEFTRQVGRYHTELEAAVPILTPALQERYSDLIGTKAWKTLGDVEKALLLRGPRPSPDERDDRNLPVSIAEWQAASAEVNGELLDIYSEHHRYAEGFAAQTGRETFRNSLIGGGAILLFTLAAAFVAARLSNRVVKRMKRLRAETLELADVRLPRMVNRLRGGEQIDVARDVPALDYGTDELGQVAEAFNKAQRTAVAAAAQEAEIQNGVKAVFLNIAHRSQVVVRRQLEVLDKAESEQEDPEHLESLFQLDHLATRARRNAENLIILGGERPGRQWRNPVPLLEIVRSAIGETEHYRRVHTTRLPELLVSGTVVGDLIHLLAELVDNATAFSPPDSRVEVRGNSVGKGVVIEVEDQGLGIPRDEREELNAFLADPPDFGVMSLSEEARLGLFVVSQLAARHGITVTLVDSAYGGIRAIVLVRSALIASMPGEGVPPNGLASESRPNLPRPRRERLNQEDPSTTTGPVHTQNRRGWPDDFAEPTVRWPSEEPLSSQEPWATQGSWAFPESWSTQESWPAQAIGNDMPPQEPVSRERATPSRGNGSDGSNRGGQQADDRRP